VRKHRERGKCPSPIFFSKSRPLVEARDPRRDPLRLGQVFRPVQGRCATLQTTLQTKGLEHGSRTRNSQAPQRRGSSSARCKEGARIEHSGTGSSDPGFDRGAQAARDARAGLPSLRVENHPTISMERPVVSVSWSSTVTPPHGRPIRRHYRRKDSNMVHGLETLKRLNGEAQAQHDAKKVPESSIPAQARLIRASIEAHKQLAMLVLVCHPFASRITRPSAWNARWSRSLGRAQ